MRGEFDEAVQLLVTAAAQKPVGSVVDAVALWMAKAELHHLEREDAAAREIFDREILPHLDLLPEPVRFVVEGNLSTVKMGEFRADATTDFYHLVDRRRQAGFDWIDTTGMIEVWDEIDAGRPAAAIPLLWQEVIRSYRQGYWAASRWAEAKYAKLCLDLGELEEAAYHAVVGEAEKQVAPLARAILARRDAELVRDIMRRMLKIANLRRHFVIAAKLIAAVHDVIPDDNLPEIAVWLLSRCRETDESPLGTRIVPVSWHAMKQIGDRLPSELAAKCVDAAVTHPIWSAPVTEGRVLVDRDDIIKAVTHLCQRIPRERLSRLTEDVLPLALSRVENSDYPDVINLLIHISELSGGETKKRIADALYPSELRPNRLLAQVDGFFEKVSMSHEQLAEFASKVASEIRLQVQHVEPGKEPIKLPETIATYGAVAGGSGPIVTLGQGLGVAAVQRHLDQLSYLALSELIHAMLAALQEPYNLDSNRDSLLNQLVDFSNKVQEPLRGDVFRIATQLHTSHAEVRVRQSEPKRSMFSRFDGDPDEVRAVALICGAAYAKGDDARINQIGELIEEAAVDPNPKIRRGAYGAAKRLPDLPADAVLPLLMGLRDPDPGTAVAAFSAFAERSEWKLTRSNWRLLLLAARSAADSPHTNLRRHAALTAMGRMGSVPSGLRTEWSALIARFGNDVSADVRIASRR